MSRKRKLLIFMDWYLPGYKSGGPVKSVSNLVEKLGDSFEFMIVTRDTDFGETKPYQDVVPMQWQRVGKSDVMYLPADKRNRKTLKKIILDTEYDGVYFNSFFSLPFTLQPLLLVKRLKPRKPVFIAPRGMLGLGALGIKSVRKRIFIWLAKLFGIYSNVIWHVSSPREGAEVRRIFGSKAIIHVAANILRFGLSMQSARITKAAGAAKFVFISRIAIKKNLLNAVEWLGKTGMQVVFDAYGPLEDEAYYLKCREEAAKYPKLAFEWKGSVKPEEIPELMMNYHFFFLPTFNENFGHAIIEAMSTGLPVIISDQTPWKDLTEKGIGYDLSLEKPEDFIEALKDCINQDPEEYRAMSRRVRRFANAYLKSSTEVSDHKSLFQKM